MATPILSYTELDSSTNNKFTVHNQALTEIEVYGNSSILEATGTAPGSPSVGDFYLIYPPVVSAVWTGQANSLTVWNGTGWSFYPPQIGVRVKDLSTGRELYCDGTNWFISGGERRITHTVGADVILNPLDSFLQVLDPNGTVRNLILPNPPDFNSDFAIVNDSDNLAVNGNTVNVRASVGGTILAVLDDSTGLSKVNATWNTTPISQWLIW